MRPDSEKNHRGKDFQELEENIETHHLHPQKKEPKSYNKMGTGSLNKRGLTGINWDVRRSINMRRKKFSFAQDFKILKYGFLPRKFYKF